MPVGVLASSSSSSFANNVAPGALGFLIVAGMALALYFLIKSMNKQLAKVGADKRTFAEAADQEQIGVTDDLLNGSRQDS
jgi:hypothetical protein